MSSAEENKVLVRRFLEAQANADPDALEELLAPDFVDHDLQPDQEPGREGFIRSVAEEPDIFSNLRVNIFDQVAEGEMFGFPRLRAHVAERGEERSLGDFLMEELYSFVGEGWEQDDDITLLTLKRYASSS